MTFSRPASECALHEPPNASNTSFDRVFKQCPSNQVDGFRLLRPSRHHALPRSNLSIRSGKTLHKRQLLVVHTTLDGVPKRNHDAAAHAAVARKSFRTRESANGMTAQLHPRKRSVVVLCNFETFFNAEQEPKSAEWRRSLMMSAVMDDVPALLYHASPTNTGGIVQSVFEILQQSYASS